MNKCKEIFKRLHRLHRLAERSENHQRILMIDLIFCQLHITPQTFKKIQAYFQGVLPMGQFSQKLHNEMTKNHERIQILNWQREITSPRSDALHRRYCLVQLCAFLRKTTNEVLKKRLDITIRNYASAYGIVLSDRIDGLHVAD